MTQTIAIGKGTVVALWCHPLRHNRFEVINGGWSGKVTPDGIFVEETKATLPGDVIWRGEVPAPFNRDYNDAIRWIEDELNNQHQTETRT